MSLADAEVAFLSGGMSAKIFPWQIPEFMAICCVLNMAVQRVRSGVREQPAYGLVDAREELITLVANLFVLARGIRGARGVHWLECIVRASWESFHVAGESGKQYFQRVGKMLKCAYRQETRRTGFGKNWGSHQEGRHLGLSGFFFLHALCTSAGAAGAAAAAAALRQVLKDYLRVDLDVPREMSDKDTAALLVACQGRVILALQYMRKQRKFVAKRCGKYNGMDAGRLLWMWGACAGHWQASSILPKTYKVVMESQSLKARKKWREQGVSCASDVSRVCQTLALHAKAWMPAPHGFPANGKLPSHGLPADSTLPSHGLSANGTLRLPLKFHRHSHPAHG